MQVFALIICFITQNPYLCIVFFMVLDLRLMKIGSLGRFPFFMSIFLCLFLDKRTEEHIELKGNS